MLGVDANVLRRRGGMHGWGAWLWVALLVRGSGGGRCGAEELGGVQGPVELCAIFVVWTCAAVAAVLPGFLSALLVSCMLRTDFSAGIAIF